MNEGARAHWLNLADEFNDPPNEQYLTLTLEDFDPHVVKLAESWAQDNGWPWPPSVGDFDRWYAGEFREQCPRCNNYTAGWKCQHCGVDLSDL
jgi:hypothetical protein